MKIFALILDYLSDFYIYESEKYAFENKIQKNYCQPPKTPYNAHPLSRQTHKPVGMTK
ncbi:hypothetical protein SAMN05421579_14545 [Xenorhabdus japonica]|uniref:Uncharacterized protein n=1 Tax=Xenorhabdus japonica TaxID=53341 RepID=A0A1I5DSL2_9GAMM|nr:hypothetical protein SAMN05421579_14545 [Xenorhabdus japonica]